MPVSSQAKHLFEVEIQVFLSPSAYRFHRALLQPQQLLTIAMASKDLSTGQLSDYIEDVHRLIKALEKKGDVTSMSRNLSKLTTLVRNRLESPPIACHHREVDYFSNFLAIMQHEFHEDPEQMLATLEHMSWAFEGVVARAELQGDVDLMGCHSHREIRAILELVVNGSMNGRADEKATAYWMRRHSLSHKKAVWLYRLSDQRYNLYLCDMVLNSQSMQYQAPSSSG